MTHAALKELEKKWRTEQSVPDYVDCPEKVQAWDAACEMCADELSAALSAVEGEAVWQFRQVNYPNAWLDAQDEADARRWELGGFEIRVLYTAPPPQQAAERSSLLALASRIQAVRVRWPEMETNDDTLEEVEAELRAIATQPQQAGRIWPDCGHDGNLVRGDAGCGGKFCPMNRSAKPQKASGSTVQQDEILVAITRGEGYEDVAPEILAEDALGLSNPFTWRVVPTPPQPEAGGGDGDAALLNAIADEYLTVEPFDMPTGQGDADVGWRVYQYQGFDKKLLAEVFHDDLRQALTAALSTTPASGGEHG